jgi:hypothetical protein
MVGAMTARLTLADESALDRRSPAITTPMTPPQQPRLLKNLKLALKMGANRNALHQNSAFVTLA